MADLKISQLTGATTPLAGTEVLPIVQSSSTVKVSVANLTAGRAVSTGALTSDSITTPPDVSGLVTLGRFAAGYPWVLVRPNSTATGIEFRSNAGDAQLVITQATGNVTFSMGNLVQGTAAKGINFTANTNAPGMTSELLNWYEEGTWTPALLFGGGSTGITYSVQEGLYTRVGRQVTLTGRILLTNKGSSTGNVTVTGVPFSGGTNYPAQIVDASDGFLGLTMPLYFVIAGGILYLSMQGATGRSSVTNTSFTNTSDLRFSMTYFV